MREKYESNWEAFNLLDMNPYKERKISSKKDDQVTKKPFLQEDKLDRVFRAFLAVCIAYYIVDTLIKVYEMRFPQDYQDGCKLGFFIHHVITVFGFKSIFLSDHFPWFLAGPMCFHTVVVGLPDYPLINNITYVAMVLSWLYMMRQEPYKNKKVYQACFWFALVLFLPLAFLAWGNCMQEFSYDD